MGVIDGALSFRRQSPLSSFPRKRKSSVWFLALLVQCELFARFRPPRRRPSYFLLRAQEKVTKEKGTPRSRLPGILPSRYVSRGRVFRQHVPVLTENARASCPRPFGLIVPASPHPRGPKSGARRARQTQRAASCGPWLWRLISLPSLAPSSGVALGGKARMSERMDARVRTGPRPASSAGHRTKSGARVGRAFSGLLLFARAKRSNSAAAEADETLRHRLVGRAKQRHRIPAFAGMANEGLQSE
jgi:hypothetical protein